MSGYLQVALQAAGAPDGAGETDRPAVLVVDDDYCKRFALKRVLAPLGYTIVEAASGVEALRCVLAQDFAVILLDVRMPGMDGFETAALLRTRPRSELTPILLSTASTRSEIIASGMYGDLVSDFMLMPVESDDLRATVSMIANLFLKTQSLGAQIREVQGSADRWRLLTDSVPVGIFQTDCHHRYTYVNPRWSEITGIPAAAALGEDWKIIMDAEHASQFADLGADSARQIEIRIPGADPKTVMLISKPASDGDARTAGWVGALSDVPAVAPEDRRLLTEHVER